VYPKVHQSVTWEKQISTHGEFFVCSGGEEGFVDESREVAGSLLDKGAD
jgi:hypothetical protein